MIVTPKDRNVISKYLIKVEVVWGLKNYQRKLATLLRIVLISMVTILEFHSEVDEIQIVIFK